MNAKSIRPDGSDGTDNKNSPEHGVSLKNRREPLKERVTTHCENPLFFKGKERKGFATMRKRDSNDVVCPLYIYVRRGNV